MPEYPYLSLEIPTRLSERVHNIANWESVKDSFPDGWDDHEFRLAEGPYPWCESLSDDCDCHGEKGRLDIVYCSDFGLREDDAERNTKSPNTWRSEYLQELRRILRTRQSAPRAVGNAAIESRQEAPPQEGFYCQVDGHYHAYSEQVKRRVEANLAVTRMEFATRSEEERRVVMSNIQGITAHWLRTFQIQECADRLAEGRAEIPDVLYKYIPKKRIGEGAPNSLRATQLLALNDDIECNVITMPDREMDAIDFLTLVQSRLKECLGIEASDEELLERSLDHGDLRLSTFIQEYLNPRVGVVALSTDLLVPTMWAHYARNTGIVVGYDAEVLRGLGFELRRVSYTDIAPIYEPSRGDVIQLNFTDRERMEQEVRAGSTARGTRILGTVALTQLGADWKALSRLLFVKGTSWEYEKEIRLLVDLEEARDTGTKDSNCHPIKVIDIPPDAIKEIYRGANTRDEEVARAVEAARGENKRGLFVGHVSSHAFRIQKTGGIRH